MLSFSKRERQIVELLAEHGELNGMDLCRASKGRIKRGTVYVTLQRMEDKSYVCARMVTREGPGPSLRVYRLSALGARALEAIHIAEAHLKTRSAS